jgi:hypothetical protein
MIDSIWAILAPDMAKSYAPFRLALPAVKHGSLSKGQRKHLTRFLVSKVPCWSSESTAIHRIVRPLRVGKRALAPDLSPSRIQRTYLPHRLAAPTPHLERAIRPPVIDPGQRWRRQSDYSTHRSRSLRRLHPRPSRWLQGHVIEARLHANASGARTALRAKACDSEPEHLLYDLKVSWA